jgi:ATP-binding cassette subfamily B protein
MLSQSGLMEKGIDQPPLMFDQDIELKGVTFSYNENDKKELNNINLIIKKGSRIGIIGETGGGKSTLVDCIMGLLLPKIGCLKIDGAPLTEKNKNSWQKNIAHVPQAIFLADTSVAENIAFGVPYDQIDFERLIKAAELAQILPVIRLWKNGLNEVIGERGIKISGGQRQRIGIARALYKKADLIVLDEATSALDLKTEENVMNSIVNLNGEVTMLIVAHRLETLKNCTQIIKMHNGEIIDIGSYEKIILNEKNKHNEIR